MYKSLEEFHYYCCPECPSKYASKTYFIIHAVTTHSHSRSFIEGFEDNKADVKTEKTSSATVNEPSRNNGYLLPQTKEATVYLPKLTDACIRKYTTTSIHKKTQYHCEKCDKSLSTKGNLKLHVKSVHDSVRYNCDKCDKSFSQKGHLNEHVKTFHENVRYSCDKCNKSYIHKTNLTAHIKSVHENIRHYCDKCDKSFTWKSALNTHIQIVHENVLYNCDKCDKSFSLKTHLKQHMKKVH